MEVDKNGTSEPENESPLRVVIVDDDPLARRVVRDVLQKAGIVVIAEAVDGHEAVQLAVHYSPDVVLMDVVMPRVDGMTATRRIIEQAPGVAVVMLSANDDEEVGLLCLRAGAAGFLTKNVDLDVLARALRAATVGEAVVSRRLTMRLINDFRRTSPDGVGMRPVRSSLTPREWEVLDLLCQARSTDDIADTLVLSCETIRSHVKNILRKLNVRSRQEAVMAARGLRSELPRRNVTAA
jgi:two-component system, NarL family, response regulator LiaR